MTQGILEVTGLARKSAYSFCFVECCLNPSIVEKFSMASYGFCFVECCLNPSIIEKFSMASMRYKL